ncbi:response regulator [Chengkuizengella sp. SCS-71B]|uniref:response regulator transcription factor n=1 Tax=Chengkuizengella sp. SCS-71B TaxID=3115290 RepID=UPI0032C20EB9
MGIKVLIADDHKVVRRGLYFFLRTQEDIEILGEAENGKEAVELANELQPDIILMDVMMPVMNGIEATKAIKEQNPHMKIIILTSFSDQDHVIPAIKSGATGYQLKDVEPDELVRTIRNVHLGQNHVHPKAMSHMMSHMTDQKKENNLVEQLTKREREVLSEITNGKSNKEIADCLNITEKTVKTHVSNILSKLHLADRTQAALFAVKHKL